MIKDMFGKVRLFHNGDYSHLSRLRRFLTYKYDIALGMDFVWKVVMSLA